MSKPIIIKWVLDTRPLWPEANTTKDLDRVANRALSLLPAEDRTAILKYYFLKDAKLALGSALLKRHVISSQLSIPFSSATPTRAPSTKPIFLLPDSSEPLIFNVSHQAGLVALLAVHHPPSDMSIGIDVVCPCERRARDHSMIEKDGWARFVAMHDSVFAEGECARLRDLGFGERDELLAWFYALWCLREGYVKMTGEALLAEWLGELEMRGFAPPGRQADKEEEKEKGLEVWFRGEKVDVDVRMEWFLEDYMICTVVKGDGGVDVGGSFELVDLEGVLDAAERSNL